MQMEFYKDFEVPALEVVAMYASMMVVYDTLELPRNGKPHSLQLNWWQRCNVHLCYFMLFYLFLCYLRLCYRYHTL